MAYWETSLLLDRTRLTEFADLLGPAQAAKLVDAFRRELATRPSMILHLARRGDLANARASAHLMKGAALSVGGERITALADAIERAGDTDLAALAEELPLVALDTLGEVEAMVEELARAA